MGTVLIGPSASLGSPIEPGERCLTDHADVHEYDDVNGDGGRFASQRATSLPDGACGATTLGGPRAAPRLRPAAPTVVATVWAKEAMVPSRSATLPAETTYQPMDGIGY